MRLRNYFSGTIFFTFITLFVFAVGCSSNNNDNPSPKPDPDQNDDSTMTVCEIILFDGDRFKDDSIVLKGSGEFADLSNLPDADKDWDDEADSFKAGENAIATFYSKPDFKGDSVVFDAGAKESSVEEPRSIKIRCKDEN